MAAESGKFILRVDPELHQTLKHAATRAKLSLNEFCARSLQRAISEPALTSSSDLDAVVVKAIGIHGAQLAGLVVFGSWVKGTATRASDLDLLVVLRPNVRLRRQVYRAWDDLNLTVDGHRVEPSIVTLPDEGPASGFWAEIATQGLVLWWADLALPRYLAAVRERIAVGELRRHRSHGQAYWVHRTEVA